MGLHFTGPTSHLIIDAVEGKVYTGAECDSGPTPNIEMFMTADISHQFWLGKVNVSQALAKGQMRAKGPVPTILKLVPIASKVFPRYEKMINIKDQGQIFRVDVDTIERIDAAGDYMCIQTGDNTLILRETMKDLEKRLDPRRFQRVHRSTIVNLDLVRQVKPHTNGECFLVLDSGAQVKVSRSYRDVVARFVH